MGRGVVTGWTGVDTSTPILKIIRIELASLQNMENKANLLILVAIQKLKGF